jgi:hypothetical protein
MFAWNGEISLFLLRYGTSQTSVFAACDGAALKFEGCGHQVLHRLARQVHPQRHTEAPRQPVAAVR